ncbi:MAG TPA: hypothetical protein PK095_08140, partial [Myxococcota bacterium]|nr:hypothetical protein [Myxococcota bacterium]
SLSEDGVGAVRWVGEVVETRVLERSKVATPWSGRTSEGLVRVYRVNCFEPLSPAIPNSDSHRFSSPRWSTRLALARARKLSELALESPLEWELVDALRGAGLEVEVKAGEVDAVDGSPRGRARLVSHLWGSSVEVRYGGANGFELRSGGGIKRLRTVQDVVAAALGLCPKRLTS